MEKVTPVSEPYVQAWGDDKYPSSNSYVGDGAVPGQAADTDSLIKEGERPVEGGLAVTNLDGSEPSPRGALETDSGGSSRQRVAAGPSTAKASIIDERTLEESNNNRSARLSYFNRVTQDARGSVLLGTFMGVYVPTTQNILGIILFIRLPWITGQAGILQAALIVSICCASSFLTSLSMSAIATNGKVQAGGCYQIIKKSLSPQFGVVVGLLLFLSNTFGVAMYILGFVEALKGAIPAVSVNEEQDPRLIGAITLLCLFCIVYVGISYISKFAFLFLSGVLIAILSIHLGTFYHTANPKPEDGIVGLSWDNFSDNWGPNYDPQYDFGTLLAIFFPAVTDPLAGSNLSGDLKDAQKSIPPGTLAAVATTTVLFLLQVFYTGGSCLQKTLATEETGFLIVTKLAWPFGELVYAGIMLSTLGAGLQSLAGAPRLISAIAKDNMIPQLAFLTPKPGEEPRKALILCASLSLACVMIGKLNAVAPFITMWFLTCYAIINCACFILAYEQSPTFRPRWKYFHWSISLLAAILILGMMFFISWYFALAALTIAIGLYKYVQRQDEEINTSGGGWQSGMRFNQVRNGLLMLQEADIEFKYWRPFVLFLCKMSKDGKYIPQGGMINLIGQLMKRGKGLAFVGGCIEGDYAENADKAREASKELRDLLSEKGIDGFPEVIVSNTVRDGQLFMLQGKGFGPLRPNTVMLGFPDVTGMDEAEATDFLKLCREVAVSHKTLMLCKTNDSFPASTEHITGNLDVWWVFDLLPARGLLLLTPYLLQQHAVWKGTKLRLFVVTGHEDDQDTLRHMLVNMLRSAGLEADVNILQMNEDEAPRFTHTLNTKNEPHDATADPAGEGTSMQALTSYIQAHSVHTAALNVDVKIDMPGSAAATIKEGEEGGPSAPVKEASEEDPGRVREEMKNAPSPPPGQKKSSRLVLNHDEAVPSRPNRSSTATKRVSVAVLKKDKFGSKLTAAIVKNSGESALVMLTMPVPQLGQPASEYLLSVDTLIKDLKRVILIQESGQERVELYSA